MERVYKEQLIKVSEQILNASRTELYLSMRFLDIALHSLQYELYVSTLKFGTDGEKILYHPTYLCKLYQADPIMVNRAYLHMLLHCMFRHMMNVEDRDLELWNIACDIAVESMIDSMEYPALHMTISDQKEEVYEYLKQEIKVFSAEAIYRVLKNRLYGYEELERIRRTFEVDDHSIWEAKKKENQDEKNPEQNKEQQEEEEQKKQQSLKKQWQQISEKVATNLATVSRNIGNEAGNLMMELSVSNRERYHYRDFLRKFAVVKEEMTVDVDTFDYIYYTLGLSMYKNMPLIEPVEYKEEQKIEEFVIAIDTSGSCSGALVQKFLQETYTILADTATFLKKVNIFVIQCDLQIQEVAQITCMEELEQYMKTFTAKGHGGTDFRPVFTYVDELIREKELNNLKGMLYFTDGHGIFPQTMPNYEVAFVFLGEEFYDVKVPTWAMKLLIEPEDIV